jgi:hypothetical protein
MADDDKLATDIASHGGRMRYEAKNTKDLNRAKILNRRGFWAEKGKLLHSPNEINDSLYVRDNQKLLNRAIKGDCAYITKSLED